MQINSIKNNFTTAKLIIIILIFLLVLIILIYFRVIADKDVLILTVDDITMTNAYEINITQQIIDKIIKHNLSATFFVIPNNMIKYDFPKNIEIAQHGYTHINPKTGSYAEFKDLNKIETQKRIIKGKTKLETLNYTINGFRAPKLYINKKNIKFLEKNYVYDSSFLFTNNKKFTLNPILDEFTLYLCTKNSCNNLWLQIRKQHTKNMIYLYDFLNKPIILTSHYWAYEKILNNKNGKKYIENLFEFFSNYEIKTMYEYSLNYIP